MLDQQKRRGDVDPHGLLPLDGSNFREWLHHCDAGVIDQQVDWSCASLGNQIGNALRSRQIMDQKRHSCALRLDDSARLRQSDGVGPVHQKINILARESLRDGPADSAAGSCNEVAFHVTDRSCPMQRPASTAACWQIISHAADSLATPALRSPQRKAIIYCLPQTKSHQLLPHPAIDSGPERANDVFARGRGVSEILRLQIQMPVVPGLERSGDCVCECGEVAERSTAGIVIAAYCPLYQITVTVTMRIVALAVQRRVLCIEKFHRVQAMRGVKTGLQPKKHQPFAPAFRKQVAPLV